jgi:hypothetical protein
VYFACNICKLTDNDCSSGLLCFQRDGSSSVPNCVGDGESSFDYCYDSPPGLEALRFVFDVEADYFELGQCEGGKIRHSDIPCDSK